MEKSSIANYLSSLYRWCKYRKLCITIDTSYVPKRAKTFTYFVMLYLINWRIFVAAIPKLQIISKVVLHIKSSKPWYSCRFSTKQSWFPLSIPLSYHSCWYSWWFFQELEQSQSCFGMNSWDCGRKVNVAKPWIHNL